MADLDFNLEEVAQLIRLVESQNLSELIVEEDDKRITIRGKSYSVKRAPVTAAVQTTAAGAPEAWIELPEDEEADLAAADEAAAAKARISVSSPMVGVFYRSSGPDTAPYVEVGDHVDVGQIIGLIEAMKVFSEVPSEVAGTVAEIVATNGELVRSGDPLMYLL